LNNEKAHESMLAKSMPSPDVRFTPKSGHWDTKLRSVKGGQL